MYIKNELNKTNKVEFVDLKSRFEQMGTATNSQEFKWVQLSREALDVKIPHLHRFSLTICFLGLHPEEVIMSMYKGVGMGLLLLNSEKL